MSSWILNSSLNEKKYWDLWKWTEQHTTVRNLETITRLLGAISTHLSSDMLQLICVFLCVLTVMKGNSIAEFFDGTIPRSSASLLRVIKLLNETCCKIRSRNCCCLLSMRSFRISISASKALHCCNGMNWVEYLSTECKRNDGCVDEFYVSEVPLPVLNLWANRSNGFPFCPSKWCSSP